MLDKIKQIERVFKELNKETERFGRQSKLQCLPQCNLCCMKKNLEANVLEFLPLAYYLVKNDLHEAAIDLLETNPEFCINLSDTPGQKGCMRYKHRGLICRLFGFSGIRDKNEKLQIYTCSHIKLSQAEAFKNASLKVNSGMNIPLTATYYSKIYYIDPVLASDFNPINVSIRKAIEKVAYYYSCKPRRKIKEVSQPEKPNP